MRIASSTFRRIVGQDLRSSHLPLCSSLCQRLVYESYARGRQEEHQNKGLLLIAAQPVHSAYKTELDFVLGFLPLADCLAGLTSFSYPWGGCSKMYVTSPGVRYTKMYVTSPGVGCSKMYVTSPHMWTAKKSVKPKIY